MLYSRILSAGLLFLSACSTTARQTEALLKDPGDLPLSAQVTGVPFVEQSESFCGPATLAMTMGWAALPVDLESLGGQTFTPGKSGTLQADMISASRRNGMLAIPVQGMEALLKEISAGHPVIVLQNLAFSWYPKWHYAVVLGYDLKALELTLHSGPTESKKEMIKGFENTWAHSKYWGLVVLPPGKLSASATELAHVAAGAGLEQLGKTQEAELVYKSTLQRWPQSLGALIGMGNTRYAAQDFRSSVRYLENATTYHTESVAASHNLAIARRALELKLRTQP